jgi:4-hydroxybenzoyl-CoA thioesterase
MPSFSTPLIVEWEDCDPAGIVFYPRFFQYFDRGSWNLWYSLGLTRERMREWGAIGMPILDAQAEFLYPCRFKDPLRLESSVEELKPKTVKVAHRITLGERLAVSGYEVRFWGAPHPEDPLRLQAAPIPDAVRELLR